MLLYAKHIWRDIEILRQAPRGYSEDEIGRRVGLHPTTVNRIINREKYRHPNEIANGIRI